MTTKRREESAAMEHTEAALPTIHVISDSVGITARALARAAASQFGKPDPEIELLANVKSFEEVQKFLEEKLRLQSQTCADAKLVVFYTLVEGAVQRQLENYLANNAHIIAVDLMSNAVRAIAQASGRRPQSVPGELYVTDERYFRRITALEFTIEHDDGRITRDLQDADIVIIGVSRTSKTPTSIYLGQQGYRVANVPLVPGIRPPKQLFDVDRTRIFGLMTTVDVLTGIRRTRMARIVGSPTHYADPEAVREELEQARVFMRELGCVVIHTQYRAVEETALEIMRNFDAAHLKTPSGASIRTARYIP